MNNESVAWIVNNYAYTVKEAAESLSRILESPIIPLYTHPVRELTDKEIYEVWKQTTKLMYRGVHEEFARAILRKAQEK